MPEVIDATLSPELTSVLVKFGGNNNKDDDSLKLSLFSAENSTVLIANTNDFEDKYIDEDYFLRGKVIVDFEGKFFVSVGALAYDDFWRDLSIDDNGNIVCTVPIYDALGHGGDLAFLDKDGGNNTKNFALMSFGESNFLVLEEQNYNCAPGEQIILTYTNNKGEMSYHLTSLKALSTATLPRKDFATPVYDFSLIPGITKAGVARCKNLKDLMPDIVDIAEKELNVAKDNFDSYVATMHESYEQGKSFDISKINQLAYSFEARNDALLEWKKLMKKV